jgi:hypothetical protein
MKAVWCCLVVALELNVRENVVVGAGEGTRFGNREIAGLIESCNPLGVKEIKSVAWWTVASRRREQ